MCKTLRLALLIGIIVSGMLSMQAQQRGQYIPGQMGLNAGVLPEPGFTFVNISVYYSADSMKDSNGNSVPGKGTFSLWAVENGIAYVPNKKILGGRLEFLGLFPVANGSLTADLGQPPKFPVTGGGAGYADTWLQPLTLGWHFSRVDTYVGYSLFAPTGRYTPGASDNIGSGYWGNHILSGHTVYLTKNKGTTVNLFTDWEIHGEKKVAGVPAGQFSSITPGQAFTIEWGLGQTLPLKKDFSRLLQIGVIGYDQWQVTDNGGNYMVGGLPVPAKLIPHYSVHAAGFQTTFILPPKNLAFFFKYEPEYLAYNRVQGRTIVFGGSWTLRVPKPAPAKP